MLKLNVKNLAPILHNVRILQKNMQVWSGIQSVLWNAYMYSTFYTLVQTKALLLYMNYYYYYIWIIIIIIIYELLLLLLLYMNCAVMLCIMLSRFRAFFMLCICSKNGAANTIKMTYFLNNNKNKLLNIAVADMKLLVGLYSI